MLLTALLATPLRPQSGGLQPYFLIGESGQTVSRTAREIVARLFLLNYRLLGRYHPGDDPAREVLIVTHPVLVRATTLSPLNGLLTAVCRIAIHERGGLTYVYVQNIPYWAQAAYGESYASVQPAMETFMQGLLGAFPQFRGQFLRPYGGHQRKPMTPQRLADFRHSGRSEGLNDMRLLKTYPSQREAVAAVRRALELAPDMADIFALQSADGSAHIIGFSNSGEQGDKALLAMLEVDGIEYAAAFPLELLVSGGELYALPLRYRLPLGAPGMRRKTFRQLKKIQASYYLNLTALFGGGLSRMGQSGR
ncbi:MAG: hypothetical protein IID15_04125 [Candidatus Marinimicrobia bacterium]|nr:hypothetical protein [Candidatus Neomarinimicrobiota bacterium]